MSDRIQNDPGAPNHREAAEFFNSLILDLKKQILGVPHECIDMSRLNEGTQHVFDLDSCRSKVKFY